MNILEMDQGSEAWLEARKKYFCASEASAMMGESRYKTREALIKEKATGTRCDTSDKNYIFNKGHQAETEARPLVEKMLGIDLYPVVGVNGKYLASFDGISFDGEVIFEHKLVSTSLIKQIDQGTLDRHYCWQLEHQLYVSGAKKVLFVASDGTQEKFHSLWYVSSPELRQQLIQGWENIDTEIKEWVSPERKDEAFKQAAAEYIATKEDLVRAEQRHDKAKQELLKLTQGDGNSSYGFGVQVQRLQRKGSIDYQKIPGFSDVDLSQYRRPPTEFVRITVQTPE